MARGYSDKIQENKEKKEQSEKKQAEQVINDIKESLKIEPSIRYFDEFEKLITLNCFDDNFAVFYKFYYSDELRNKAIFNFITFFKRVIDAKNIKKDILVIRYENYLKALDYLKNAFYFYPDGTIEDKFMLQIGTDVIYEASGTPLENELSYSFSNFKKWSDIYFQQENKIMTYTQTSKQ